MKNFASMSHEISNCRSDVNKHNQADQQVVHKSWNLEMKLIIVQSTKLFRRTMSLNLVFRIPVKSSENRIKSG